MNDDTLAAKNLTSFFANDAIFCKLQLFKLLNGILIFDNLFFSSSLLQAVFSKAAASGLKFRVIVADGRPKLEGRQVYSLTQFFILLTLSEWILSMFEFNRIDFFSKEVASYKI